MLLRLSHTLEGKRDHRVEITFDQQGTRVCSSISSFVFSLSEQDEERLRWYMEDYLRWPQEPAPRVAAAVERLMRDIGEDLFHRVFAAEPAASLWTELRSRLGEMRVEIAAGSGTREATILPWELLLDPETGTPLVLAVRSFVRTPITDTQRSFPSLVAKGGPIRILLVICRPGGGQDVPFRSVAARILRSLDTSAQHAFNLNVLRPPTFAALDRTLRQARAEGRPYHVVHFDGHGIYDDLNAQSAGTAPTSPRGYLAFESPDLPGGEQFIHGSLLGEVLAREGVPLLLLNACRSAHAEVLQVPEALDDGADSGPQQTGAFGSLAQEVLKTGVPAVLAMRYNVYVVTAARFVANLYTALADGWTLGEAVTEGRRRLHAEPFRSVTDDPLPLQDWAVPIVYEATPLALFPSRVGSEERKIDIQEGATTEAPARSLGIELPAEPEAGFFGMDETLLAIDRAFDRHPIVLLHAYAGSGKSSVAAEFARWYAKTGGIEGLVLFTSFEQYISLPRVLDRLGQVFDPTLKRSGIHWLALSDTKRRVQALELLRQQPVLWIWDNVEPISGFPRGAPSAWTAEEQRELADFLREARGTRARFLVTSRRREESWLGEIAVRILVRPLRMSERLQLARALAEARGHRLADPLAWRPLLQFTEGNPLALRLLIGQAFRDGLENRDQIEAYVWRLREGEAVPKEEQVLGRARSLDALLRSSFEHAFTEVERWQLALLYFFQRVVNTVVLCWMGDPREAWCLREIRGLTRDEARTVLDRAAEVGLLATLGDVTYAIHPALPLYFKEIFDRIYGGSERVAARAFVESMASFSMFLVGHYEQGNILLAAQALAAEEANLLHAVRLARREGWWSAVMHNLQGLRALYQHTDRGAEWRRLIEEVLPDIMDPATEIPVPGREDEWGMMMQFRVHLARRERDWEEAKRLQRLATDWFQRQAAPVLETPPEELDDSERNLVRSLAATMILLGDIEYQQGNANCLQTFEESLTLFQRIGDPSGEGTAASNIGHAYADLPAAHDLERARYWLKRGLALLPPLDRIVRSRALGGLGYVAMASFHEAEGARQPRQERIAHLNEGARYYTEALACLPAEASADRALNHCSLGAIHGIVGDFDRALAHYQQAVQLFEAAGDFYGSGRARFNVALDLARSGRPQEALEYAQAALRNYEIYGEQARDKIAKTKELIRQIRRDIEAQGARS